MAVSVQASNQKHAHVRVLCSKLGQQKIDEQPREPRVVAPHLLQAQVTRLQRTHTATIDMMKRETTASSKNVGAAMNCCQQHYTHHYFKLLPLTAAQVVRTAEARLERAVAAPLRLRHTNATTASL